MANEERDVPDLPTLLNDFNQMQERLDKGAFTTVEDLVKFLQNDLLPAQRDLVDSVIFAFEDVQDEINPVRIPGAEAKEALTILQATVQTNPHLKQRIEPIIEILAEQLGEGDDEEPDEDAKN